MRTSPPLVADERAMLASWLDFHRATLARKTDGVAPQRLAERTVVPSALSLLGLVRHLAEVERYWFRIVFRGEQLATLYCPPGNRNGDFDDVDSADPIANLARWQEEVAEARRAVATASLDELRAGLRHGEPVSLRWIMVHMIEEYARHNGHADLLRERLDGATGA